MLSRFSTSIDLSLVVTELDEERYHINAFYESNRLKDSRTAFLPRSEVSDHLIPLAEQLRQNQINPGDLKEFGRRLFEALVRDQVRELYRFLEGRNEDWRSFRLLLNLPHILQRIPWECMVDPYWDKYLSLRSNRHIIRQVDRMPEDGYSKVEGIVTLVISIADARGQPPIHKNKEENIINKALEALDQKINYRIIPGSQEKIQETLSNPPDVFHFVGHGGLVNDIPGLYLEDNYGDAIFVTASELENKYLKPSAGTNRRVRLLVLSACQTSETPKTEGINSLAYQLASQVDAVLAMQYPILLENVTKFNYELYLALASGVNLETAINSTRQALISDKPRGARDWIAPMMLTHQLTPANVLQINIQNPFKGPKYYDISDRERLPEREVELKKLGELYRNQKIIVIKGESGSGKTSFLRAGLMPKLGDNQQLVDVSLSENLETDLRREINRHLIERNGSHLTEGLLEELTDQFPPDMAIVLDRVETVEYLGDEIARILEALIRWVIPGPARRRAHLVLATRLNERGEEPDLLQQLVPEKDYPRLYLKMLSYDQALEWITAATRKSQVIFLNETINAILHELNYEDDEERNMMALQVVCSEVYVHARDKGIREAKPELLSDPELGNVEGILERELKIESWLKQLDDKERDKAKKVLEEFVSSNRTSMRPRSWDELYLRSGLETQDLSQVLDQLLEGGLLRLEPQPGGEMYELVHESLTKQIDWLKSDEIELRKIEEFIESARYTIPKKKKSEDGKGLEDLDLWREQLKLTVEQQKHILQSALEADHETDYWFKRVEDSEEALLVLTSTYLTADAQERACHYLGDLAREGEVVQEAKGNLLKLAHSSEAPQVRQAASQALAPLLDEPLLNSKFGEGREDLKPGEIEALARMFDGHWLPLKGLTTTTRRRIRYKMLKLNAIDIIAAAMLAACLGAAGFALASVWIYAQAYRSPAVTSLPPLLLLVLEFALVGLLTFILALPGALIAPLGRDLNSILSGGRRTLPAALGAISGSALGTGLTVLLLGALAEIRNPSLSNLIRYFISGALLGSAVGFPWLASAFYKIKPVWLVLSAGLLGALAFLGVSSWDVWWPATSFALTLDPRYGWGVRLVPGMLIGLGSAVGLAWGRLRNQFQ